VLTGERARSSLLISKKEMSSLSDDDGQGSVLYSDPYDSGDDRGTRSGGRRSSSAGRGHPTAPQGLWGGRFSGGGGAGAGLLPHRPATSSDDGLSDASDALTDPLDDFLARYTCDIVPDVVVGKLKKR